MRLIPKLWLVAVEDEIHVRAFVICFPHFDRLDHVLQPPRRLGSGRGRGACADDARACFGDDLHCAQSKEPQLTKFLMD